MRARVLLVNPGLSTAHRGSFLQVLDGLKIGLTQADLNVHVWDASRLSDDEEARVPSVLMFDAVVLVGPPVQAFWWEQLMFGAARLSVPVYWMLAANSQTLPLNVVSFLRAHPELRILTPSTWSKRVIEDVGGYYDLPRRQRDPLVVPHGVEVPADVPPPTETSLAHCVAGTSGRKGTGELIEAMALLWDYHLVIYADATALPWVRELAQHRANITVAPAYNASPTPPFWKHETYVQPSRAEGYGICAVEAWMLGRRVIMRRETGEPLLPEARLLQRSAGLGAAERGEVTWEGGDGPVHPEPSTRPLFRMAPVDIANGVREAMAWRCPAPPTERERALFSHRVAVSPLVATILLEREQRDVASSLNRKTEKETET